jgi:hypothetical protein
MWLLVELRKAQLLLAAILAYALGVHLVLLSGNLASPGGAAVVLGLLTSVVISFLVSRRFGRVAGLWLWALLVVVVFAIPFIN